MSTGVSSNPGLPQDMGSLTCTLPFPSLLGPGHSRGWDSVSRDGPRPVNPDPQTSPVQLGPRQRIAPELLMIQEAIRFSFFRI